MKILNKLFFFIIIVFCILLLKLLNINKEPFFTIPNTISGIVKKGSGEGNPIFDYPTANIDNTVNLPCGIYIANSNYGDCVLLSLTKSIIECHIKKFNGNLYGKKIVLKNIQKLDGKNNRTVNIFNKGCKTQKF